MNKITILGTGTSTGVPILGCLCSICQSKDLRNHRLRCSALIQTSADQTILVDSTPDMRTQLLRAQVKKIDGVILTHDHADHTHGLDDLRPFCFQQQKSIPIFTGQETSERLGDKFPYIFQRKKIFADKPVLGGGIPELDLYQVQTGETFILGEKFTFFSLPHGHSETLAFTHRSLGYIVDCREIPENILHGLNSRQLELLIIDCLRYTPHQTHLHFEQTLKYIEVISPKTAILTHMGHELEYLDVISQLRRRGIKNVFPGVDGQSFFYS